LQIKPKRVIIKGMRKTAELSTLSVKELFLTLKTHESGLSLQEVIERQTKYGLNILAKKNKNALFILLRQFTSNVLIIILLGATIVSYLLGDHISAYYIFGIILVSIFLGFWNEYSAEKTVESRLKKISPTALVVRSGEKMEVPVSHLTPGDLVFISQGSIVPADLRLIQVYALEMNESSLTGESKSVYKTV